MGKFRSIETLVIDSNILCCNFVNTVSSWKSDNHYDYLANYNDFIEWCSKLGIVNSQSIQTLRKLDGAYPAEASAALNRIKEIRRILHGFVSAIAQQDEGKKLIFLPEANLLVADALSRHHLQYDGNKFFMEQTQTSINFLFPVWKILYSLVHLVTNHDLHRIKECPACGWVFLDETRNGSRKWCNPKHCGTSDKMKRYNKRKSNQSKNTGGEEG